MNTRTVQRSPNLGLGIRMQRLPQSVQRLPQSVQQAFGPPAAPWWWGWTDTNGQRLTTLGVVWDADVGVYRPDAYWPGLWVAVVEGATSVRWDVKFTPKIWFKENTPGAKAKLTWQGADITLPTGQTLPGAPTDLFTPAKVALPNPLDGEAPWSYWEGAGYTDSVTYIPAPRVIAAGNTLSVAQDTQSMSGSLVAQAFVDDVSAGSVWLDLMREIPKVW